MDILDDMGVSKLSAKVFFFLFFFSPNNKTKQNNKTKHQLSKVLAAKLQSLYI